MVKKDSTMPVQKIPDFIAKRLLEEYRELGLCWKHDDEVFTRLAAVLLPLAIAALTLPYLKVGAPKLLATVGGLMLMVFWFFSSESGEDRSRIRFSRIHEIERILGFDSHLRIKRERANYILKGQHLRRCTFIAYIVIALLVTCDVKVEPTDSTVKAIHGTVQFIRTLLDTKVEAALWTIDMWTANMWIIKLVVTVETIIVGTISLFVMDICTCIWAWKRVGKRNLLMKMWHKIQSAMQVGY